MLYCQPTHGQLVAANMQIVEANYDEELEALPLSGKDITAKQT